MTKKIKRDRCIYEYVKKDGSSSFHAEIRRKDTARPLRKSFENITKARNWVKRMECAILDGREVFDNKAQKRTLADLIEYYIKVHLSKFPSRLKDQTYHLNWWNENYGRKRLTEITPALLTEAKETLLDGVTHRKINRSEATVNRYFSTLSKAFSLASREWQWISENPFRRISKLKEGPGRNRFLSKNELQILLEKCKESKNPHLYGMVLIAASMGLRFGEIVNLRWRDIRDKFITLEETKNGDIRILPMTEQLIAYFTNLRGQKESNDYVFPSKDPLKRHPASLIRKAFKRVLELSEIKNFTFHDLRHTAASHLGMNGATQGELMAILGHRSPTMTKRYAHYSSGHLATLLQKTSDNLIGS